MVPLSKSGGRKPRGFESHPLRQDYGEVLEWSIRRAWRARVANGDRGFESHPLRHYAFGVFATHAEDISVNEILPAQDTKNRFGFRHRCC